MESTEKQSLKYLLFQGKTRDQLVRGRYLVLPKNLEVMECRFCGTEYKGQPVEIVLRHIEDQCGLKESRQSHIIFSCRYNVTFSQIITL